MRTHDTQRLAKETQRHTDIYTTLKQKFDETTWPEIDTIYQKVRDLKKTAEQNGHTLTMNIADQICHLHNLFTDSVDFVMGTIRTAGSTPTTILYTDQQIDDIQTLCCTGQTVLGVDKTFNLGCTWQWLVSNRWQLRWARPMNHLSSLDLCFYMTTVTTRRTATSSTTEGLNWAQILRGWLSGQRKNRVWSKLSLLNFPRQIMSFVPDI